VYRLCDVLEQLGAKVGDDEPNSAAHLIVGGAGDADAAGLGNGF